MCKAQYRLDAAPPVKRAIAKAVLPARLSATCGARAQGERDWEVSVRFLSVNGAVDGAVSAVPDGAEPAAEAAAVPEAAAAPAAGDAQTKGVWL
jgi:hypothetical protein